LTGGFHHTFWVLGAIALTAPPAVFMLARRARRREVVVKSQSGEAQPAVAAAN
jgi:hypothetical protein